jgi:hypothetical protein
MPERGQVGGEVEIPEEEQMAAAADLCVAPHS